jgi:hypothetical protein
MNMENSQLLSHAQIEKRYGITRAKIHRWVTIGRLTPIRIEVIKSSGYAGSDFRFHVADVEQAIELSECEVGNRRRDPALG